MCLIEARLQSPGTDFCNSLSQFTLEIAILLLLNGRVFYVMIFGVYTSETGYDPVILNAPSGNAHKL
jgi:hypothetical protein